jgi:hypothetical protein
MIFIQINERINTCSCGCKFMIHKGGQRNPRILVPHEHWWFHSTFNILKWCWKKTKFNYLNFFEKCPSTSKNSHRHLPCAHTYCSKFEAVVGGVDYTKWVPSIQNMLEKMTKFRTCHLLGSFFFGGVPLVRIAEVGRWVIAHDDIFRILTYFFKHFDAHVPYS